jgi:hypothetical protein
MENLSASELPSDRDSPKFFLLKEYEGRQLPFTLVPIEILTPNGQGLVQDFFETKGGFLGGGVMKSSDFAKEAKVNPRCRQIRRNVTQQIYALPKSERQRMSAQITTEWIAFEYSLVISQTIFGHITSIKWGDIVSIEFSRKMMSALNVAKLTYRDKKGLVQVKRIESSKVNIASLKSIAIACEVLVK